MILDFKLLLTLFGLGLLAVTVIDVFGSISSRKLYYPYVYLTPVSFLAYGLIGYHGYQVATLTWTLIIVCVIGLYDGTVGWKLSIILKANFAGKEEYAKNLNFASRVSGMILMSGLFGLIGFIIAGYLRKSL